MKLLKNLGWFLLAILSFVFIYGTVQSGAVEALNLGASPYATTLLYVPWLEYMCTSFINGTRKLLSILRRVVLTDLFGSLPWFGSYLLSFNFSYQMILR